MLVNGVPYASGRRLVLTTRANDAPNFPRSATRDSRAERGVASRAHTPLDEGRDGWGHIVREISEGKLACLPCATYE